MESNRTSSQEIEKLYAHYLQYPNISTDSRSIKQGDIFFALKGENFDGNEFVFKAIEQGAKAFLVEEDIDREDTNEDGYMVLSFNIKRVH